MAFPLNLLPRQCPVCGKRTITGHGQRRKQAHDEVHDVIHIRRGRCRPCHKTFTILPVWSPPHSPYSFHCRQQAAEQMEKTHGSWESVALSLKDPNRLPDPSTLRRWVRRRLVSLWSSIQSGIWKVLGLSFLHTPTILAWDLPAACRILRLEAISP